MIEGHDVSKWQADHFHTDGIDFVIIEVTKGMDPVNPRLAAQTAWARSKGLSVGFYHFAKAGNMTDQANLFLKLAPIEPGDHLWFDWEDGNVTCAQKDGAIRYLAAKAPGHRVGLYCNGYFWGTKDTTGFYGDALWIAAYAAGEPAIKTNWLIHQYSDQGGIDKDRAKFNTRAEMKAWATKKETSVAKGPQKIPFASQKAFYGGGSAMEVNVGVVHTTEGRTLPTYGGGGSAPNVTGVPDFKNKKINWFQHFDVDKSARALVNKAGGVETNTLNAFQVELVGTCDPSTSKKWGGAGTRHIFWPDAPDWALAEVAKLVKWLADNHAIPLTSAVHWKAYPASYGANGVRLSGSAWNAYKGWLGHQHVPENDHGDPGDIDMKRILELAGAATPPPATKPPVTPPKETSTVAITDADVKKILTTDGIIESPDGKGSANEYWTAATYLRESYLRERELGNRLAVLEGKLEAILAKLV